MPEAAPPWWERPLFVFGVGIPVVLAFLGFLAIRYVREEARYNSERNAVWMLRSVYVGAQRYAEEYGNGFPPALAVLGQPAEGDEPSCRAAGLVAGRNWESLVAMGRVRGYRFEYRPGAPVENPSPGCPPGVKSYTTVARPSESGNLNRLLLIGKKRSFLLDESGSVHWTTEDQEPRAEDPAFSVTGER